MLLNPLLFVVFFVIVTTLYFIIPHRWRWLLLLAASCIFYMSLIPLYILVLAALIVVDYIAGRMLENRTGRARLMVFLVSICFTLSTLFVFKYFDFFSANVAALASLLHWNYSFASLRLILPIGLSFHTFQSMSYVIEMYRGTRQAERNFGIYALYVMFYPQLMAGPIERPQNLLPQFREVHAFEYERVVRGLTLMLFGCFKKIVIADTLAISVDTIFNSVSGAGWFSLWSGAILFAFQIYCDFSGYCDIAVGAAQVMGFRLMDNFRSPYGSTSIRDFWRRWHISLSTWFRDYVYIPLGGSKGSALRWGVAIMIVFLVSGLWHGANWTFVVWGGLHGMYMVLAAVTQRFRLWVTTRTGLLKLPWLHKTWQMAVTFILVDIAWVFFRASSIGGAWQYLRGMFSSGIVVGLLYDKFFGLAVVSIAVIAVIHCFHPELDVRTFVRSKRTVVRWLIYLALIWAIWFTSAYGGVGRDFIYFQF